MLASPWVYNAWYARQVLKVCPNTSIQLKKVPEPLHFTNFDCSVSTLLCSLELSCSHLNSPALVSIQSNNTTVILRNHAEIPATATAHLRCDFCATREAYQSNPIQLLCGRESMCASPPLRRSLLPHSKQRECRANLPRPQAGLEPCDERASRDRWHPAPG